MSQILSQVPRQVMSQQMRLTPQLIQAMDILQLNALALESRIDQELDGNPALEYAPDADDAGDVAGDDPAALNGEHAAAVDSDGALGEFERLDRLVEEYDWLDDEYRGGVSAARLDELGESKLDAMAAVAARPASLQEHLLEQWAFADVDDRTRDAGRRIIEALDQHGRLTTPLPDVLAEMVPAPGTAESLAALRAVQQLEPRGVGARSLQECLLLQLDMLPGDNTLERRILMEHFDDLQRNRIPQIAKALRVEVDEIKDAIAVIGTLSMHPAAEVVSSSAPTIVPDLIVEHDEVRDAYEVRLARANSRELRISPEFRELLERSRGDPRAREFVKQKIDAAAAIIDAVQFRRDRLLQVGKAVVEAQREFLDRGPTHLRVLRMSELAERFGCDPSTISRTVDEKTMLTPRGAFPLRSFFTGGAETDDGEALGWASIRAKVQEIIDGEDKGAPLNDDEIVERLQREGVEIKRRTIAKYRAQLNIPSARQRRRF